jgi:hypothetical protein
MPYGKLPKPRAQATVLPVFIAQRAIIRALDVLLLDKFVSNQLELSNEATQG